MEDILFNGIWRMDWGLGSPNKTAALIAQLMVAVWWLAYGRKWGFWAATVLFVGLGWCLVHTFSRGGLLSALAGLVVLAVTAPRPWQVPRIAAVGLSCVVICLFAVYLDAHRRYSQGVIKEDRSISNRWELWKATPSMMSDAPRGWGVGESGKAYMRWYQPLQRREQYRTLVSSHLTWLVEVGWPLRFLYVFAWSAVLLLCLPTKEAPWQAVPFGAWLAFGVAACFSSVAESAWLWGVPGISLAVVLGHRWRARQWPRLKAWAVPVGVAALTSAGFLVASNGMGRINGSKDRVVVGRRTPEVWVVVDERILGRHRFARSLREYLATCPNDQSIGIVESLAALPHDLSGTTVVVTGTPEGQIQARMRQLASAASRLVLLSPGYEPEEAGLASGTRVPMEVIFGEFSQAPSLSEWEATGKVRRIGGVGDFFANWPQVVLGELVRQK